MKNNIFSSVYTLPWVGCKCSADFTPTTCSNAKKLYNRALVGKYKRKEAVFCLKKEITMTF